MARRDWEVLACVFPAPLLLSSCRPISPWVLCPKDKSISEEPPIIVIVIDVEICLGCCCYPACLEASLHLFSFFPVNFSAISDNWQKRQTEKIGGRRDDMWQRLHARLAGTQHASESSEPQRRHETQWFTALAASLLSIIELILHVTVHFIDHYDYKIKTMILIKSH